MRSNMFGYAGAPMPLPRLRPPGTSTISHAFRTPESSTSEEEDRTDLLGRSFQTSSRPKSRSSLAVSAVHYIIYFEIRYKLINIIDTSCISIIQYTHESIRVSIIQWWWIRDHLLQRSILIGLGGGKSFPLPNRRRKDFAYYKISGSIYALLHCYGIQKKFMTIRLSTKKVGT